jgi:fermentation-respiration switch protein FrsA (DUF1100 family)
MFAALPARKMMARSVWHPLWVVAGTIGLVLVALGAAIGFGASHLIYFPVKAVAQSPANVGLAFDETWLTASDGTRLHGWYVPAEAAGAPVVLFLHGNAGNISHRLDKLDILHAVGAATFILDYRGYGRSDGRPNEAGLYRDGEAAYRHLTDARGIDPRRLIVYGESLGSAVAVHLAADRAVGGIVLEAAFTSARDVAREIYGRPVAWLIGRRFATLDKMARVHAPVLILHSRHDEFFGMHHAERLLAAAAGPKSLVELRGGHNDAFVVSGDVYRRALQRFVAERQRSSTPPAIE